MVMKYARSYRDNYVSVVVHTNGMIPPDNVNETCFVTGPSQYKFHDEQQIEEKSTLLIQ
jgi:hypothetical protein